MWSAQVTLSTAPTLIAEHSGNVLYALKETARTLSAPNAGRLAASDENYLFHPYVSQHISVSGAKTLAEWQAYSGLDIHSTENWFMLDPADPPLSRVFYNDTAAPQTIGLGTRQYLDLAQNEILGSIVLQPFTSIVLIDNGEAPLTLTRMMPSMMGIDEAADFPLALYGAGFSENSVVRWDGADRPTSLVNDSALTATVYAADASVVGDVPVTVYDPSAGPSGTETPPLTFRVVESVTRIYLPLVLR
jgi:hypothetical protein